MNFGQALEVLKKDTDNVVSRENWYGAEAKPVVKLQVPDENSKMTEPYLYMRKFSPAGNVVRFPLDLSCESILADDWYVVVEFN